MQRRGGNSTLSTTLTTNGRLTLRGDSSNESSQENLAPPRPRRHVRWSEDVVDNEHLNKKKSKVCCIYERPTEFGESSSDESSSSSSDSDSESDTEPECSSNHDHHHHHDLRNGMDERGRQHAPKSRRLPSPNAYERQKTYKPKPVNV